MIKKMSLLLETAVFNFLMAPITAANAVLDLIENESDYHNTNGQHTYHAVLVFYKSLLAQIEVRAWLYLLCFFVPPLAIYFKFQTVMRWSFWINVVGFMMGAWPFVVIHSIYCVKYRWCSTLLPLPLPLAMRFLFIWVSLKRSWMVGHFWYELYEFKNARVLWKVYECSMICAYWTNEL